MHASICMHFSAAWVQSTKLAQENRSPNDAYVLAYDYDFMTIRIPILRLWVVLIATN